MINAGIYNNRFSFVYINILVVCNKVDNADTAINAHYLNVVMFMWDHML